MATNRWDVARRSLACHRCSDVIGAGEQYRQFGPRDWPTCIDCAKKATGEDPPADMPIIPTVPTLKPPVEWFDPNQGMPPVESVIPALASPSQRQRIIAARKRLETPAAGRDWWNK